MDGVKTMVVFFLGFIGCAVLLAALLIGIRALLDMNIYCPAFGATVDRPVRWSFFGGGCFVQDINGQWVQTNNYWNNTERAK